MQGNQPNFPIPNPAVLIDQPGGGTTYYVGLAVPGSATADTKWQIRKLIDNGTALTVLFADGNADFDNVWDARASLVYS